MKRHLLALGGLFLILSVWWVLQSENKGSPSDDSASAGTRRIHTQNPSRQKEGISPSSEEPQDSKQQEGVPLLHSEVSNPPPTNISTSSDVPFGGLGISDTLDSEWKKEAPTTPGWHERIRIVRTDFKSGLLRIIEQVRFEWRDGRLTEVESRIHHAADARHLLVSKNHEDALGSLDIHSVRKPGSPFTIVPVKNPEDVRSIPALAERLEKALPGAIFEQDAVIRASAQANDPVISQGLAWHLDNLGLLPGHKRGADIGANRAWDVRTDASPIIVAMIDSGISPGIPDLNSSLYLLPGETLGDGIDNDGNGYIDDVRGYDFYDDDASPDDANGHGTMCAALIGATGNNRMGSAGVAWKASILNCRFLNRSGHGLLSDAINAIEYARSSGAKILNLSWSYEGDAPLLAEALAQCDQEGILMICAAGNSSLTADVPAPANIPLPHVIAVAASTPGDTIAEFSIVDPRIVDLAAPGVDLPVYAGAQPWNPSGEVKYGTGTSFSAALVSGGLALGLAEFPTESPLQIVRRMMESVKRLPGGTAALVSGGRLDLGEMLVKTQPGVPHDLFVDRAVLLDQTGRWTGRNDGAGIESVDANLALTSPPLRSLWFEWTASSTGLLRMRLSDVPGHPTLSVFSAVNDLPGTLLGRTSGQRVLELSVTSGQRLFWMLDSSSPISRGLTIEWQLPPPNDNWAAAELLTGMPLDVTGNSLGATVESFETIQSHHSVFPEGSVWWKWTPPATGAVRFAVSRGHLLLVMPLGASGAPVFPLDVYPLLTDELGKTVQVTAGQPFAVMVIPNARASAGPFRWSATTLAGISIFAEPQNVSTLEGETVVMEVTASPASMLKYQWFKNGKEIPFAQNRQLRINPVSRESFGVYQVKITNGQTVLMSREAEVSPRLEAPRLISQTPRKTVVAGQAVGLSAVFRSNGPITYAWSRNGSLLSGQTAAQLNLSHALIADSGTYVLRATNSSGTTVASFQIDVVETPWKGWLNRTPAMNSTGQILQVELSGQRAGALTSHEWMNSSDGGRSWSSVAMPAYFQASSGASHPDGSLLISGTAFRTMNGYGTFELWRRSPAGNWTLQQPILTLPGSAPAVLSGMSHLTNFDSEWWGYSGAYVIHSADGIQWTAITDPSNPSVALRADDFFRFEDRIAISYRDATSGKMVMYCMRGGATKTINLGYGSGILKIGETSYHSEFGKFFRRTDQETTSTVISSDWSFGTIGLNFTEGYLDGDVFQGLHGPVSTHASMHFGIHEKSISAVHRGYSCFAKSGANWLVGYSDGRLWTGSDLSQMPMLPKDKQSMNPRLNAHRDEFRYGAYHSSDGAAWQLLGAASDVLLPPSVSAGGSFLHTLKRVFTDPEVLFFSDSIYPVTVNTGLSSHLKNWGGETAMLQTKNDTGGRVTRLITDTPGGITSTDVNLGVDWAFIHDASQWGGRWFVRGDLRSTRWQPFLVTSSNGIDWNASSLPQECVIGGKAGSLVAIENGESAYLSSNGVSWTPVIPQGLPSFMGTATPTRPDTIVSYRGYFVARYGKHLYASADGVNWAEGSAPSPAAQLMANRHTLLLVTTSGEIMQPGGESESGPWIDLAEATREISVPLHQGFRYELDAGDADGDLVSVECLLNGLPYAILSAPPFTFEVNPDAAGPHAIEFVARDSAGRVSRTTSKLTMLPNGVTRIPDFVIDANLDKAVMFRGDYYRVFGGVICKWQGGSVWRAVSPSQFKAVSLCANEQALVASSYQSTMASKDGMNWLILTGLGQPNQHDLKPSVVDGVFRMSTGIYRWVSDDGFNWQETSNFELSGPVVWASGGFGFSGSIQSAKITRDGGKLWFPLKAPQQLHLAEPAVAARDAFFVNSEQGIYRLLRTDQAFTLILPRTPSMAAPAVNKAGDFVFLSNSGSLRSTVDGIHFTEHTPPPDPHQIRIVSHLGKWLAVSERSIWLSDDLTSWRQIHRFGETGFSWRPNPILTVSPKGLDSLHVDHSEFHSSVFIIGPDFTVTSEPTRGAPGVPNIGPPPASGADPRIVSITATAGEMGVGDFVGITLRVSEIADLSVPVRFSLTADHVVGNADDRFIAMAALSSGTEQPGSTRHFQIPLPVSIEPGTFRVAAQLELPETAEDIALENNQRVTNDHPLVIPGYELLLNTSGSGSVQASDPRILYPKGTMLRLQAVPGNGHSFRGWEGSLVSAESMISVLMDADKEFDVLFSAGHQITVRSIGHGSVQQANARKTILDGEIVEFSQTAGPGWTFSGWRINGANVATASLAFSPTTDTLVEAVFIPDFSSLLDQAFDGAPEGTDRSWSADPDNDGLTNWQEILLSMDPLIHSPLSSRLEKHTDRLRFIFTRPAGLSSDPWVEAEFSDSLSHWQLADASRWSQRILETRDGIETVELTLPCKDHDSGFLRLKTRQGP